MLSNFKKKKKKNQSRKQVNTNCQVLRQEKASFIELNKQEKPNAVEKLCITADSLPRQSPAEQTALARLNAG